MFFVSVRLFGTWTFGDTYVFYVSKSTKLIVQIPQSHITRDVLNQEGSVTFPNRTHFCFSIFVTHFFQPTTEFSFSLARRNPSPTLRHVSMAYWLLRASVDRVRIPMRAQWVYPVLTPCIFYSPPPSGRGLEPCTYTAIATFDARGLRSAIATFDTRALRSAIALTLVCGLTQTTFLNYQVTKFNN